MITPELDRARMEQALELARGAFGQTEPNPRVGCVLGNEQGAVFGAGATQQAGGAHAEVMALNSARAQGQAIEGATAWVTLEPCAHQGRTPPCCDALIAARLARVVVALEDPFPQVAGAGLARLRAAGIRVEMAEPALALAAWEINIGFFSRVLRGRPWVRVKLACSLDGRTGLDNGLSQWITSEAARIDGHAWRKRAAAVMTGIGTVLADDPRLDVRLGPAATQPLRVVVDSALRTPPSARLLSPPGKALIATAAKNDAAVAALERRGAELLAMPGADGRVDLCSLMTELGRRGVNELHVEGGAKLTASLLRSGLADELLVYIAPRLLGGSLGLVDWHPLQTLQQGVEFDLLEHSRVGPDLRLRLRPSKLVFTSSHMDGQSSKGFTPRSPPE